VLTSITKGVKLQKEVKLPLEKLITLYISNTDSPFLKNFSQIYINLGFERITNDEKFKLFPALFSKLKDLKDEDHRSLILRYILDIIKITNISNKLEERSKDFEFIKQDKECLKILLEYFKDFYLLQSNYSLSDKIIIPNGLSVLSLKRVVGAKGFLKEELYDYKVNILNKKRKNY
jgi:hypothetical protein